MVPPRRCSHATRPRLENAVQRRLGEPTQGRYHRGSTPKKERDAALRLIESGEAHVVVGTHLLISDDVVFKSLGLGRGSASAGTGPASAEPRWRRGTGGGCAAGTRRRDEAQRKEGWENRKRTDEKSRLTATSDRAAWAAVRDACS